MDLIKKIILFLPVIGFWSASINCDNFFTRPDVADGLSLPYEVQLLEREDLFIKISKPVSGQTNCEFRSPGNDDVDVEQIDSNKLEIKFLFLVFFSCLYIYKANLN